MVIAMLAMVSMLGALSMVVDAGIYFVIQHQLQNAADAAALDAVWYYPVCDDTLPSGQSGQAGCQTLNPDPAPAQCTAPPAGNAAPCTAAVNTASANLGIAMSLCQGPNLPSGTIPVQIAAGPLDRSLNLPNVRPYVVTVSCQAPHWFARVLPGVNLTALLSASSSAAIGWPGPNGQLMGQAPQPDTDPPTRLVARLIVFHSSE
jgi:Flp pilus assembly protein TadG